MQKFSSEQLKAARIANLYDYLYTMHGNQFKVEGDSLRFRDNHSISIKKGYSGYMDFANGEKGNSIDFLTRYMGYSIDEAVNALAPSFEFNNNTYAKNNIDVNYNTNMINTKAKTETIHNSLVIPEMNINNDMVYQYLNGRGIDNNIIDSLVKRKLLYQSSDHNNLILINYDRDYGEMRGIVDSPKKVRGNLRNSRSDGYWWFNSGYPPEVAYVCEAGIDAISLYLIHKKIYNKKEPAVYISVGGCGKQSAIERIKSDIRTIIAVDNNESGSQCRKRNMDCACIIPKLTDWNDDLVAYNNGNLKF